MRFYPKPLTREEARNFIRVVLSQYRKWDFGWWALVLKHSGTFVGYTGLTLQEVDGVEELELGYMVRREYWGQGIATEAARACSEYAFDTLGYNRIISIMDEPNVASRRVAEKNGMAFEKMTKWKGQTVCIYAVTNMPAISGKDTPSSPSGRAHPTPGRTAQNTAIAGSSRFAPSGPTASQFSNCGNVNRKRRKNPTTPKTAHRNFQPVVMHQGDAATNFCVKHGRCWMKSARNKAGTWAPAMSCL